MAALTLLVTASADLPSVKLSRLAFIEADDNSDERRAEGPPAASSVRHVAEPST
jgi:hypothetical protein